MERLLNPHERAALSQRLSEEVDTAIMAKPAGHSWRLGPSSMGTDCDRQIWYGFRWVKQDNRDARMRRLLEHGKLMEARFEAMLLAIPGFQLWTVDPNAPPERTNKQFRVRALNDHVGGYLDGIAILPPDYGMPAPLVVEFKSSGTGKIFNLTKTDVHVGHPEHAEQAGYYGWKYDFKYSIYASVNKNDDDITWQIIENDFGKAALMEARMREIILSPKPPRRAYENATDYRCNLCRHKEICHRGADYEKNCRSCEYATPDAAGEWKCNLYGQIIPRHIVKVGCEHYHPVGR